MSVCKHIDGKKRAYGQHHGHCYISCHIRPSRKKRNYTQQIAQKYNNVNFELDKIAEALGDPSKLEMVKKMIENV